MESLFMFNIEIHGLDTLVPCLSLLLHLLSTYHSKERKVGHMTQLISASKSNPENARKILRLACVTNNTSVNHSGGERGVKKMWQQSWWKDMESSSLWKRRLTVSVPMEDGGMGNGNICLIATCFMKMMLLAIGYVVHVASFSVCEWGSKGH